MICRRCRSSILSRFHQHHTTRWTVQPTSLRQLPFQQIQTQRYSDVSAPTASPLTPKPPQPTARNIGIPSAAPSATSEASQPRNTAEHAHKDESHEKPSSPSVKRLLSSCPAGTKMTGLNFYKNKPDIYALDDSEYPDWLWTLLADKSNQLDVTSDGIDLSLLNKKQRKRYEKKQAARAAALPPEIPAHHQAVDITPASYNQGESSEGDSLKLAAESLQKRDQITRSARNARRKSIREANFLKGL